MFFTAITVALRLQRMISLISQTTQCLKIPTRLVFEEFQNSVFDALDAYDKSFLTQTMHHYHLSQCIASNFKRTLAHFPCKTALFLKFPMRHFGSHNSLEYLYKCNKQIQMKSKWYKDLWGMSKSHAARTLCDNSLLE